MKEMTVSDVLSLLATENTCVVLYIFDGGVYFDDDVYQFADCLVFNFIWSFDNKLTIYIRKGDEK